MRKTRSNARLCKVFAKPLSLAFRVRHQRQNQRGRKVYSLHAPEVECIGKGKGHRPYEFGVKVSVASTLMRSKGGQLIAHVRTLPGNPYDGHTLETVIPEIETQIGASLARIVADRGYRGHNAPPDHKMKVYVSGQKRVTDAIKRDLRRRSAVEPVIGHAKNEHRPGPQLPERNPRRRRQCDPRRRRLQLPQAPRLARHPLARPRHGHACRTLRRRTRRRLSEPYLIPSPPRTTRTSR
jgi:hypothetical protein